MISRKIIDKILNIVGGVAILLIAGIIVISLSKYYPVRSNPATRIELVENKIHSVLSNFSLASDEGSSQFIQNTRDTLVRENVIAISSSHIFFNPENNVFNLLIDSKGGYIAIKEDLSKRLIYLKQQGGIINCFIKTAMSAAFSLVIEVCDHITLLKDFEIMQHRIYNRTEQGDKRYNSSGVLSDMRQAAKEAKILNLDPHEWLKISRAKKDKYFTKAELVQYNIIKE